MLYKHKGPGTSFQVEVFVEFYENFFVLYCDINCRNLFTSQVIQLNVFLVLCLDI